MDRDFSFDLDEYALRLLSQEQRDFFCSLVEKIKNDHFNLKQKIKKLSRNQLLKQLNSNLFVKEGGINPDKTKLVIIPGGIGILVGDTAWFDDKFSGNRGVYRKAETFGHKAEFPGRIVIINSTKKTARETFKHEYLHLLTAMYIELFELSPRQTKKLEQYKKA